MTSGSLLLRLRCLLPAPGKGRQLYDALAREKALRAALLRAHHRHESMREAAFTWKGHLDAAGHAAEFVGYAEQTAAAVIYTLAGQLEQARLERDEALRVARELAS